MARVMVTGATGFVGANLARRLVADRHDVHLLIRPTHAQWRIDDLGESVTVHSADLADVGGLAQLVANVSPRWVFHLAAYGAYPYQTDVRAMVQSNIVGTLNLIHASAGAGVEVVVNTGSSSEYGAMDHAPAESESCAPNSNYAVTKLAATLLCQQAAEQTHMRIPTLRLYSVYGPFEEPSRLMPTLVLRGREGKLPRLADPRTARDFIFVDDVVEAYLHAAYVVEAEPGAIFNVGTGKQSSLAEVVATAREVLSILAEPDWGSYPDRMWDTDVWVADRTRAGRELGWTPRSAL